MAAWLALLRAVNVGGHGVVAMADLRALLSDLGFADVRSVLQTGNLIFEGRGSAATIERRLEEGAAARLGLQTRCFVRSASDMRAVIERNPFQDEARDDPARLVSVFLKRAPTSAAVEALRAGITGRERLAADDRHLYIVYPDGQGRSRLNAVLIEKRLSVPGTARNWNTVLKLGVLLGACEGP